MKTELHIPTDEQAEITYPVLAKSRNSTLVVLFTADETGVVVRDLDHDRQYKIGHTSDGWISVKNSKNWQILPAGTQLIITQE